MEDIFQKFFCGKKILITGHTGFKGSWLTIWLNALGAKIIGFSIDSGDKKGNFRLTNIGDKIYSDIRGNIQNFIEIEKVFKKYQPEIVFHLAALPLVVESYKYPLETWKTNVIGTLNVLECIRKSPSVKVGIIVSSDKCYENTKEGYVYKETDRLGGYDPYSSSKAAVEIALSSWRNSFFKQNNLKSISSVRAGNVIGGGDWAKHRIIPDCVRNIESNKDIIIRSPLSIRPWQFVLEPLRGYMQLVKKMWENPANYNSAWNFGPRTQEIITVKELVEKFIRYYGGGTYQEIINTNNFVESKSLILDCTKIENSIGWLPILNIEEAIKFTAKWYLSYKETNTLDLCLTQLNEYSDLYKKYESNS
ncbi:MAG: CDP-glucose 4,6-dehydratase [Muribaculaceae bacterium]|nr:CDP-glucose 4,6-dehydratase [Muribaculaceae bacterium]